MHNPHASPKNRGAAYGTIAGPKAPVAPTDHTYDFLTKSYGFLSSLLTGYREPINTYGPFGKNQPPIGYSVVQR